MRGGLGLDLAFAARGSTCIPAHSAAPSPTRWRRSAPSSAALHDADGRVAVPGFYDAVRAVAPAERAEMARIGPSDAQILRNARAPAGAGEPGFSAYERTTIRPTLSVNGVTGGYGGPGAKAVIPTHARAKLSFRLVEDQEPATIERLVRGHVARAAPPGVSVTMTRNMAARPAT